ncbi:putative DNA binding protein [Bacillus phage Eldridge]|uniref:Putative DNA binding protein n=1 Tax=Bacillus phage Eldridge TaxID=1776293 RepID=A0A0Y0AFP1_9CAUD|nr:putative DNA binding protein [Bacillus phage Eldridge]AMB18762.1 putative DNA binding protein [Bacillus phage Eldridge]
MDLFTEKLYSFLSDKMRANQEEKQMSKTKTFADVQQELWETDPYRKFVLDSLGKVMACQDRLKWSQDKLADEAGLPYDTVHAIFEGDIIPGVEIMNMLMKAVGFEWTLREASGEDEDEV